jgi:hypothetical protein
MVPPPGNGAPVSTRPRATNAAMHRDVDRDGRQEVPETSWSVHWRTAVKACVASQDADVAVWPTSTNGGRAPAQPDCAACIEHARSSDGTEDSRAFARLRDHEPRIMEHFTRAAKRATEYEAQAKRAKADGASQAASAFRQRDRLQQLLAEVYNLHRVTARQRHRPRLGLTPGPTQPATGRTSPRRRSDWGQGSSA